MASKNLWGNLSNLPIVRSPKAFLQEQADCLTKETGGTLVGDIDASQSSRGGFAYDLDIQVPALNNYVYTVLRIAHDVKLYPLTVHSAHLTTSLRCEDEQEFEKAVSSILGSKDVKQILARLLSQAT